MFPPLPSPTGTMRAAFLACVHDSPRRPIALLTRRNNLQEVIRQRPLQRSRFLGRAYKPRVPFFGRRATEEGTPRNLPMYLKPAGVPMASPSGV
jgi:hypothetical protein